MLSSRLERLGQEMGRREAGFGIWSVTAHGTGLKQPWAGVSGIWSITVHGRDHSVVLGRRPWNMVDDRP